MSTTSLKLSEVLKQRVAKVALNQSLTLHAFVVKATEHLTVAAESRAELIAQSMEALESTLKSGEGYDVEQVHTYLKALISGQTPARPKAMRWQK